MEEVVQLDTSVHQGIAQLLAQHMHLPIVLTEMFIGGIVADK
jgi:hypothetical protein